MSLPILHEVRMVILPYVSCVNKYNTHESKNELPTWALYENATCTITIIKIVNNYMVNVQNGRGYVISFAGAKLYSNQKKKLVNDYCGHYWFTNRLVDW